MSSLTVAFFFVGQDSDPDPYSDEQSLARRKLRELPGAIKELTQRLADLTADRETTAAHAEDPMNIGDHIAGREDATAK